MVSPTRVDVMPPGWSHVSRLRVLVVPLEVVVGVAGQLAAAGRQPRAEPTGRVAAAERPCAQTRLIRHFLLVVY